LGKLESSLSAFFRSNVPRFSALAPFVVLRRIALAAFAGNVELLVIAFYAIFLGWARMAFEQERDIRCL
jgi:hypothetical protein